MQEVTATPPEQRPGDALVHADALVIVANPDPASFTHATASAATAGLRHAGHTVEVLDLYAQGFRAAMSEAEHRAYPSGDPIIDDEVARSAAVVRNARILVMAYPTWWSTVPAVLKGWMERTLVEGVAFRFDEHQRVRPALTHVQRLVGISTYGSRRAEIAAINDNGRRLIMRTVRLNTGWRTRRSWLGLYSMDTATAADRSAFLAKIEQRARRW